MQWKNRPNGLTWSGVIKNEEAKREAAARLAAELQDGQTVGIGSGSTSFLTLQALAARAAAEGIAFTAIPTSIEVANACAALGLRTATLNEARPDWCFDGADEVDPKKRLIKGRGGALYREKLMMAAAPKAFIVVDQSKIVERLGQNFAAPVEIDPDALSLIFEQLADFPGLDEVTLRPAGGKDGPVITERGNLTLDLRFSEIADDAHTRLKQMSGVVETGLFFGYDYELILAG
ncbi:ribose 5-phosphate isomerase [Actinoplanes sp. SE50]|uniref:ribose 5-phosphate isomerase A n=1 Tax=unclassified Actinoplanes TaxID=2626549 RepID=UPI00023ED39D|nr:MULTISPECIES: ribose 5-phosphate isomerase A [unclassified Actinoplanes]AEV82225.1 ribose 5-phosphate isomerase A [Actinoplanes sp. SE50/110]ATO80623.1 ribose 5-phosphate isomerase [Actinoplanes sp. SE50]SLL98030.1 ribose 5-phosphate isomerase A [Actinoplanes sp. SE50/110]